MLKLFREYKSSLKDIAVEEAVDLFIFRPIAFLIVKAIYRLPITPNQISLLSMTVGIASGVFFAFGSHESFIYGALLYFLAHVLDCCDGMIARLKKCGTPIGRIVDGWTDYVVGFAVYIGFLIGLSNSTLSLPMAPLAMMIPASISLIIHSMMVDYYRHEFLAHGLGKATSIEDDRRTFSNYLKTLKKEKRNYLEILLITFYLGYTGIQTKKEKKIKEYPQDLYYHSNRRLVFLWNWIGAATHIFMFILGALLYEPMIFFVYIIGLSNIWMLGMIVIQVRTNRRIMAKVN
jgi:phosphatidylglycerophosphate synthase